MKAMLCYEYGPPESLKLADIPEPTAGPGEVLIAVRACGVNFPDMLVIQGKYQYRPDPPFAPGSDIAGVVKALGEGVTHFSIGDEVLATLPYGGFVEVVAVPVKTVFAKPAGMSFVQAAAFTMVYGTSYHALRDRADIQPGETLLVLGAAGGVGLTAVELGKQMGARVIAAASTDEKLELCRQYGADAVINYSREDLKSRAKELTDGRGVDVVYDPVGGDLSEAALRATAIGGRFLVIGFASGEIPKIALNLPLLKRCQIVGVFWGAFALSQPRDNMANMAQLAQWLNEGRIKPHIHAVYPLAESGKAIREIMDRKVRGKIVVEM